MEPGRGLVRTASIDASCFLDVKAPGLRSTMMAAVEDNIGQPCLTPLPDSELSLDVGESTVYVCLLSLCCVAGRAWWLRASSCGEKQIV